MQNVSIATVGVATGCERGHKFMFGAGACLARGYEKSVCLLMNNNQLFENVL